MSNFPTHYNLPSALTTVHSLQMVGFGVVFFLIGSLGFSEGCVFGFCLYTEVLF